MPWRAGRVGIGNRISTWLSSEAYVGMCGHHHPPHGAPISAGGIQDPRSADSATVRSCVLRTAICGLASSTGCPVGDAFPQGGHVFRVAVTEHRSPPQHLSVPTVLLSAMVAFPLTRFVPGEVQAAVNRSTAML